MNRPTLHRGSPKDCHACSGYPLTTHRPAACESRLGNFTAKQESSAYQLPKSAASQRKSRLAIPGLVCALQSVTLSGFSFALTSSIPASLSMLHQYVGRCTQNPSLSVLEGSCNMLCTLCTWLLRRLWNGGGFGNTGVQFRIDCWTLLAVSSTMLRWKASTAATSCTFMITLVS